MYKRKIMAFICAVLIFIIGCASSKQMTWQELKYDEVVSMIDGNKTFYAFFKRDDCPHCPPFEENLREIAERKNLAVYVVDTSLMSDSEKEEYIEKFNVQYVPVIYNIQEGNVIDNIVGDTTLEELRNFTE